MSELYEDLKNRLVELREQGMQLSDINPVSALSDMLSDRLYTGQINTDDIGLLIEEVSDKVWQTQANLLARKASLAEFDPSFAAVTQALCDRDISKPLYRAVFTAHPVFALQKTASDALCDAALEQVAGTPGSAPKDAYQPRTSVTLQDEHEEAMAALTHARATISKINAALLRARRTENPETWRDVLPVMVGVSTWVGYDLDGRSDIGWLDTFMLRIKEKQMGLAIIIKALDQIDCEALVPIRAALRTEEATSRYELTQFAALRGEDGHFADVFNTFTEREGKLVDSAAIAHALHTVASQEADEDRALAIMVVAADLATHGFGMGEVHFRINAVQLRNAMRSVDGRSLSSFDNTMSSRLLLEGLAERIQTEEPWQINFATVDAEATTARRQLMLAAQFIKHIDSSQPLRLLIAECERPITYMSALYLAHKLGIKHALDISPLFETAFGLEHGVGMMSQLFQHQVIQDYIRTRGRLAIQLGFSDAGRFMGQLAANLAIERLQVKILNLCARTFGADVELLMFNTHGESMGRGCGRPDMAARQDFILTPFVRNIASKVKVRIYHQSSFQGGDGYRLFGNQQLADATLSALILAETKAVSEEWQSDPFYKETDFALDLFFSLKQWHEKLFVSPDYALTLDVFGSNLLPKTGSRPTKRVVQAGSERRDASKIRAIPHNAILQQLGYLAIVISGIGTASSIEAEQFAEKYESSPRLRQLIDHVDEAKTSGSLNTLLSYARLMDNGFWITRAYHGIQTDNQRAYRQLASQLEGSPYAVGMRQTAWRLRDDLIYLYRLFKRLSRGSLRISGTDRVDLDLLHAIRLAIITDSLIRVAKVPRFAESNRHSNAELINAALRLDFDLAAKIISVEFPEAGSEVGDQLVEVDSYGTSQDSIGGGYQATRAQLLEPLARNQARIRLLTQLISAHFGAHG